MNHVHERSLNDKICIWNRRDWWFYSYFYHLLHQEFWQRSAPLYSSPSSVIKDTTKPSVNTLSTETGIVCPSPISLIFLPELRWPSMFHAWAFLGRWHSFAQYVRLVRAWRHHHRPIRKSNVMHGKESRYVQTLLMRNKLRSLPLRCDFTLSSLKLCHCWTVLYLTGWLPLLILQPGHKRYHKRTESCSINAISPSVQIQHLCSTWRLSKVVLLEGLFD